MTPQSSRGQVIKRQNDSRRQQNEKLPINLKKLNFRQVRRPDFCYTSLLMKTVNYGIVANILSISRIPFGILLTLLYVFDVTSVGLVICAAILWSTDALD